MSSKKKYSLIEWEKLREEMIRLGSSGPEENGSTWRKRQEAWMNLIYNSEIIDNGTTK